jgi:hypothetical protein
MNGLLMDTLVKLSHVVHLTPPSLGTFEWF